MYESGEVIVLCHIRFNMLSSVLCSLSCDISLAKDNYIVYSTPIISLPFVLLYSVAIRYSCTILVPFVFHPSSHEVYRGSFFSVSVSAMPSSSSYPYPYRICGVNHITGRRRVWLVHRSQVTVHSLLGFLLSISLFRFHLLSVVSVSLEHHSIRIRICLQALATI
jgi:hypothetical protein